MSKHTIERISGDHYIIDDKFNIKYNDSFESSGWMIEEFNKGRVFPDTDDNFLNILNKTINEPDEKPRTLTPPAGL
jgi:hypothetical protein